MKTAISIPDSVFQAAERLAKRTRISRSELYTTAISEYVETHSKQGVTERLNEVHGEETEEVSTFDPVLTALQLYSLPRDEW